MYMSVSTEMVMQMPSIFSIFSIFGSYVILTVRGNGKHQQNIR